MVVGVCEIEFYIPGCSSLKEKRLVLRSLKDRLRNRMNVAVSEADHHERWQRSTLCLATVSNDAAVVHSVLSKARNLVEKESRIELLDVHVELR
ncbi:MAG: DUF503 domain-containing protein [Candidatus Krumholzibacteriia bacterium]